MTLERVEFTSIRVRELGEYTDDYDLLTPEETGFGETAITGQGTTIIRGMDADGKFVDLAEIAEPPGDGDEITVEFYGHYDTIQQLENFMLQQKPFHLQRLSFATPPVDIPSLATRVEHVRVAPPSGTLGAGRNRDASGGLRENTLTGVVSERVFLSLSTSLSSLTNAATEDALSVFAFTRDIDRSTGYRGPDKVIYVGLDDTGAAAGSVLVSTNGGSSWAAITTDPTPFAGVAGVDNMVGNFLSATEHRLVVSRETEASTKAQFAYGDFTFGSESADPTWVVTTIAATSNADAVEAMIWPQSSRLYIAAAGDIYLSTDRGESDPGAAIFTGSNAIAQFAYDKERNVWAVGAANAILLEQANQRGTFTAKTGPNGGGAFHSIARAKDGAIYAGNGTSIYRNTNKAATEGGWTSLKDFGANHQVVNIFLPEGSSQIIYAVVNDTSGNEGDVWFSINGGLTWTEKTNVTNSGYRAAAIASDPNVLFVVGDVQGSNPAIHKLS